MKIDHIHIKEENTFLVERKKMETHKKTGNRVIRTHKRTGIVSRKEIKAAVAKVFMHKARKE